MPPRRENTENELLVKQALEWQQERDFLNKQIAELINQNRDKENELSLVVNKVRCKLLTVKKGDKNS